ncbi:hypothetical protein NE237_024416 [Protea cynaroides]|uniref:DUF4283 domain-containing protein n=1 Tax=Protea cynaroides TaxID=273540 RepID=A0A9Q0HDN0_9MAGN|nr:hypothetical protein NE237_024416 [Protea cynaroides]
MAISESQTPHVNLVCEENSINHDGASVEPLCNIPSVNCEQQVWSDGREANCIDEFPPLVSSPPQRKNLNHISEKNFWSKPPCSVPRQQYRFNLRFIPPTNRDNKMFGVCSRSVVAGELAVVDYTLVVFFLGKKPSFSFVRSALIRQWKLTSTVEILQLIHGRFAFRFSELCDRDNILDGNVYFVGGQPLFIRQWERSLHNGGILGLKKVPLWVSLPGLPLHLWGEESLSSICSVLGNPLYTDSTTAMKNRWIFARACVEFSDIDAGYTVEDYVDAPVYGGVAALDVQAGEDEHDASCECPFCVYL